jgi:hypothetical protein
VFGEIRGSGPVWDVESGGTVCVLVVDRIATVAEHNSGLEWQLSARSSDIHDAIVAQSPCEDAWAKRPVPANVGATNENGKSHNQEGNLNSSPGSGSNQVA